MNNWRSWFAGVVIAAGLVGAVLHWGELRNFAALLQRAQPGWLILALALQLSTYASVASGWREVLLRAEGKRYAMRPLLRIALSKLFADQALRRPGWAATCCWSTSWWLWAPGAAPPLPPC
jgi:hypothetical protein